MGQSVAYGRLLNSCSYNTLALSRNVLFDTSVGRDNGKGVPWERSPMIVLSSISLQEATLRMGHTQDHIHFELNKVL